MTNFQFASPKYLLLLLVLLALYLLMRRLRSVGRGRLLRFVSQANLNRLLKSSGSGSERSKHFALWSALALIVIALARPQANPTIEDVEGQSLDIYVLLDVSRSMDSEDIAPSRLRKAKKSIQHLMDLLSGDRIGVIGFAGSSTLLVPLTSDYEIVRNILQQVDTSIIPSQGTDIEGALELAQQAMQRGAQVVGSNSGGARTNIFLVLSDGEDHGPGKLSAIDSIKSEGGTIFSIAFGTEKGVPIPVRNDSGVLMGYKRDRKGGTVLSSVQPKALQEIAQRGGGQFYFSTLEEHEIDDILARVQSSQRSGAVSTKARIYEEFFIPVLAAALALLLYSFLSLRSLATSLKKKTGIVSLLLLALCPKPASANPLSLFWNKEKKISEQSQELSREGKPEAAAEQLKILQAENPDSAAIDYNLGTYLLEAKKLDEGRKQLDRVAKDKNFFQAEALYNLAGSYMLEKKRPQAISGYADLIRRLEHKGALIGKEKEILKRARESLAQLSQEEQKNPQQQQGDNQQNQKNQDQQKDQKKDQQKPGQGGGEGDKKEDKKDDKDSKGDDKDKKDEKKPGEDKEPKEGNKNKDKDEKKPGDDKEPPKGDDGKDQQPPKDGQQGKDKQQNMPPRHGGTPFKERENISESDAKRILESLKQQEGDLQKKFLKKNGKGSKVTDDENGQDW
jgi:Ca-activated chloride channel family protein